MAADGSHLEGNEFGITVMKAGELTVWLRQAAGIRLGPEAHRFGREDPYAELSLGSSSSGPGEKPLKSTVARNEGSTPSWNDQSFKFDIDEHARFDKNILYIILKDRNHVRRDGLLGELMIDIPVELAKNQSGVPSYVSYSVFYGKQKRGQIQLSLAFREKGPDGLPEASFGTGVPQPVSREGVSKPLRGTVVSSSRRVSSGTGHLKTGLEVAGVASSAVAGAAGVATFVDPNLPQTLPAIEKEFGDDNGENSGGDDDDENSQGDANSDNDDNDK